MARPCFVYAKAGKREMSSGLEGDWEKLASILDPKRMQAKLGVTTKKAGVHAASAVKKAIVEGSPGGKTFAANHPFTVSQKGSSKPLINNGDLVGSITHEEVGLNTVWVGVKKGSRSKNGGDIVDIAWVHEFGCTIRVTERMRAYLHGQGLHLKQSTEYIVIPERSFLRATLNDSAFREEIGELYIETLKELFLP